MTFDEASKAAIHMMDSVSVPKVMMAGCAGLLFLSSTEAGLVFTGTSGGGLLFRKTDAGWSQPVACGFTSVGFGATIGVAKKDMVVVLNHFAMERFITDSFKLSISGDIGGALGPVGAAAESAMAVSNKGGGATAFIYTHQTGAIINAEVKFGGVENWNTANYQMYNSSNAKDIIDGKAQPVDASKVDELKKSVEKFVSKGI